MIVWLFFFFFFKQKTAYEMRISDWSSDVCSSDLAALQCRQRYAGRQFPVADQHGSARGEGLVVRRQRPLPDAGTRCALYHQRTRPGGQDRPRQRGAPNRRSQARRVGKECVNTCNSRWSPDHKNKKQETTKKNT